MDQKQKNFKFAKFNKNCFLNHPFHEQISYNIYGTRYKKWTIDNVIHKFIETLFLYMLSLLLPYSKEILSYTCMYKKKIRYNFKLVFHGKYDGFHD